MFRYSAVTAAGIAPELNRMLYTRVFNVSKQGRMSASVFLFEDRGANV